MLADDCDFGGTRAKRGVFLSYRQARTLRVTLTLSLTLTLALPPLDRWGCLARYAHV